jgi:dihydrofolate synthase/folylpolyglutamate synthase
VTGTHLPGDEAYFAEWAARRPGDRRSLPRARAVADRLLAGATPPPVLAVVGSKGKGTAALHAAATLSAAARPGGGAPRGGLVASPGLRSNLDRIRLDGAAIDVAAYEDLGDRLRAARAAVPAEPGGYLSPTGAFTVAGVAWLTERGADALVLEEGLGGRSDEVSLFPPAVVAVTPVFREHGDLLGGTVERIAEDLLGVVVPGTAAVVTVPQDPAVAAVVHRAAGAVGAEVVVVDAPDPALPGGLPPLVRSAAGLGVAAGRRLAARLGAEAPSDGLRGLLGTVRLPGRCSRHVAPGGAEVVVDGGITPEAVAAAAAEYAAWRGVRDTAVVCLPDDKPVDDCLAALAGFDRVLLARTGTHLPFAALARHGAVLDAADALREAARGGGFLAVGTQSFVADALTWLDVDTAPGYGPRP